MTTLLSLPVETTQLILGYLSADDLRAFRQTCRDINAKTFSRFARTYFQTRYVMLEKESLNTLIHISEHPLLGPEVRTLGLCTDHFPEPDDDLRESQSLWSIMAGYSDSDGLDLWPSGELSMWPEDDDDDDILNQSYATTYRRNFDAQEDFLSGPDVEALGRAMSRLSNCTTLLLTDACIPWGAARLEREIGELDRGLGYDDAGSERFVKHVLHVMLTAANASKLPLEELCIYLGQEDRPQTKSPISFHLLDLSPGHMAQSESRSDITSLTTLKLLASPPFEKTSEENDSAPTWSQNLTRFIGLFPHLAHFSLAFSNDFDLQTISPCLYSILSIPQLRKLELARLEVAESELAGLLLRHQSTLEEISLWEVVMDDKVSWTTLLKKIEQMPQVHGVTLKDCWLSALNRYGVTYDYELGAVYIRNRQGFKEAIAMVEELEMIWNLD